jgi:hypothetical protein
MVPMQTERVKKICPAAASQTFGLARESNCGVQRKLSPAHALASGCAALAPDVPIVSPRIARKMPKRISSGIPILAVFSTPPLSPRESIHVFRRRHKT